MKKKMKTKISQRTKNLGKLERSFLFDRSKVDEENRTIEIAFSSEEPVERWWGTEILGHAAENVRLGRMNDGGALLVDHDPRDHIGTIVKASIDSDRRGRAVVRFGRSARAEEVYQDVLDGIRKHISVGYRIHSMEEDRKTETFTANDWEPYEASLVSIPADASVGVGRNLRSESDSDIETKIISEERIMKLYDKEGNVIDQEGNIIERKAAPVAESAPAISQEERDALIKQDRKNELQRTAEIRALGKEHGQEELAETAIAEGTSVDAMRVNVLDVLKDTAPIARPKAEIGLTANEARGFSMLRALNALANPTDRKAQAAAAFEIECSNAVAEKRGIDTAGFFVPENGHSGFVNKSARGMTTGGIAVPYDVTKRDLSAGTATDGQELVADNLLSGSFIDVLRNSSVVASMGATMLTDLTGDVSIPRKTSGSVAQWITTEGGDAGNSDPQFDQVQLTPKTAGVYTDVTRQLLKQSSLDVEALLRSDLAAGMATLIDYASLYGSGASGQPQGIATATDVNLPTDFVAAIPTFLEIIAMETAVDSDNALMGAMGYIMNAAMKGGLKGTPTATNSGIMVWGAGNEVNGHPVGVTNQISTAGNAFFGNWADLLIGAWGGLDLLIDPYTNSLSGTVRVVAHQSVDVAIRHGQSFAFNEPA